MKRPVQFFRHAAVDMALFFLLDAFSSTPSYRGGSDREQSFRRLISLRFEDRARARLHGRDPSGAVSHYTRGFGPRPYRIGISRILRVVVPSIAVCSVRVDDALGVSQEDAARS